MTTTDTEPTTVADETAAEERYKDGLITAAHALRVAVENVAQIEHRDCCQGAVVAFALGMADGFERHAGRNVVPVRQPAVEARDEEDDA